MQQQRWFDKNSNLSELVSYLSEQDDEVLNKFSQHILQILIYEFNFDLDKEISKIAEPCDYSYNRWYDNNIELFTIFQFIKSLSNDEQNYLVDSVISHILIDNLKENKNESR